MIIIIATIYIFFILSDIWSTVENYFQKILRSFPEKINSPLFTHPPPPHPPKKKFKKYKSPVFANIENCSAPPAERETLWVLGD